MPLTCPSSLSRRAGSYPPTICHYLPRPAASQVRTPSWGPHLHRWGAAFPDTPLLPADPHGFVRSAGVAFAGDFVDGERPGTVEGAALSGLHTAERLAAVL